MDKGDLSLIEQVFSGNDLERIANTITAIGNSAKNRGASLLAKIVNSKAADLEVRRSAVRGMAKSSTGMKLLLKSIEADMLDPSLTSVAASELHRSGSREIRAKAQMLFPLPPSRDAEPLPSIGV